MKCLESLGSVVYLHPKRVLVAWLCAAVFSACFAMKLVDSCRSQFDPIPNTPSFEAQARFGMDFPKSLFADVEIVLISCRTECVSVMDVPFAKAVAAELSKKSKALDASNPGLMVNWTDAFEFAGSGASRLPGGKSPYLAASQQTALFELTWQVKPGDQAETQTMLYDIQRHVDELNEQGMGLADGPKIGVELTGSLALFSETLEATKGDIEKRDGFILPWALLVLLYRIQSWRLLLIPGFCLAVTIATSFTLFLPFAYFRVVDISPFCPTAMLFLSLALSIDYSLFLLTRFVEEVKSGADTESAVKTMLVQSGHVVGVSGCVLFICYAGVLCFPSDTIRSVGMGNMFCIAMCIATNLTITPAAISMFPNFFTPKVGSSPFAYCTRRYWRLRRQARQRELEQPMTSMNSGESVPAAAQASQRAKTTELRRPPSNSPIDSPAASSVCLTVNGECCADGAALPPIPRRRCWIWIADAVTKPPGSFLVPIIVLGLMVAPVTQVFKYKESFANSLTFPRVGQASAAYRQLGRDFPASMLAPVYLLQPTGIHETKHVQELNDFLRATAPHYVHAVSSPALSHPHFQLPHLSEALTTMGEVSVNPEISAKIAALPAASDSGMEDHFNVLCHLGLRILGHLGTAPFDVKAQHLTGLATLPGKMAVDGELSDSPADGLACLHWNSTEVDDLHKYPISGKMLLAMDGDIGESYREMWSRLMSENGASSMLVLAPPFDPYGELLRVFIHTARDALAATHGQGPPAMLLSSVGIVVDIVEVAYARFPYILAGTICLVFFLVAFAFKAAFAPIKMFFTVVIPLAAVFGTAVWIYQERGLDSLGITSLSTPPGAGLHWGTPVFTCTIVIGLALDYDVFLFARVLELRQEGFNNKAAIRGAIFLTGPIITSAGMIMAIALGGLLLCDVPSNNQIGFVLTFGVLVDTFVIRTCLVPAVLSLGSTLNYWPQKMPIADKSDDDLAMLFAHHSQDK